MSSKFYAEIDLKDQNNVKVRLVDEESKLTESKTVTYSEFLTIVNDSEDFKEPETEIPKLPDGTVALKWTDASNYRIAVLVPAGRRYSQYFHKELMLPYPSLVFKFEVRNGKVAGGSSVLACTDDYNTFGPATRLYEYPYGNVSTYTGNICWGGNPMPKIKEPYRITGMLELFFSISTNNDLWSAAHLAGKHKSLESFINRMSKRKEFPANELKGTTSFGKWFK